MKLNDLTILENSSWEASKKSPYKEDEISKNKCIRCEGQAKYQRQICSDDNNYRPICASCDIELNKLVLNFMKHPNKDSLSDDYKNKVLNTNEIK